MPIRKEIYQFFADYIFRHTGIFYPEQNYYQLDSRLTELASLFCLPDVEQLYQGFATNVTPQMHQILIDLATNNETSFFRDKSPFEALVLVKNEIMQNKREMLIWSAACSGGQEPYSMVMALAETGLEVTNKRIRIIATDISQRILEKARSGIYNQLEAQRGLPIQYLVKYFNQVEKKCWQLKEIYRECVEFQTFNLLSDIFPRSRYDVIFCRNVLIYQKPENKTEIVRKLGDALLPGGYLFLGNAENIVQTDGLLVQVSVGKCTAFRRAPFEVEKATPEKKSG